MQPHSHRLLIPSHLKASLWSVALSPPSSSSVILQSCGGAQEKGFKEEELLSTVVTQWINMSARSACKIICLGRHLRKTEITRWSAAPHEALQSTPQNAAKQRSCMFGIQTSEWSMVRRRGYWNRCSCLQPQRAIHHVVLAGRQIKWAWNWPFLALRGRSQSVAAILECCNM